MDVGDSWQVAQKALFLHRTQIDPENPFWKIRQRFGNILVKKDTFVLFKARIPAQRPEYDLFEGLR